VPGDYQNGQITEFWRLSTERLGLKARPPLRRQSGARFAAPDGMNLDVVLGRSLAFVRRPHAGWRRLNRGGRAALTGAYAGMGYLGTLILLWTLH